MNLCKKPWQGIWASFLGVHLAESELNMEHLSNPASILNLNITIYQSGKEYPYQTKLILLLFLLQEYCITLKKITAI